MGYMATTGIAACLKKAKARINGFRRNEDGAALVFALIIFILMLVMGGLAVDVARMEAQRIKLQQTVDRAVLAAADIDNPQDPEVVVADYFEKTGLSDFLIGTTVSPPAINSRTVEIETKAQVATAFLHMVGVNSLASEAGGAATEEISDIEISLVVDVSGSMNGSKLQNLKEAAGLFFDTVMNNVPGEPGLTSVSIIPYNAHVNLGRDLAEHTNLESSHDYSTCGRFRDDWKRNDFATTEIDSSTFIERNGHFPYYGNTNNNYNAPSDGWYWCEHDDNRHIMVHQTDPEILKTHLNAFWASGWTAIDQGMKWGAALIDPAFDEVLEDMIDDTTIAVPEEVRGRPAAWDDDETMKVIVLMTDGSNTVQRDHPEFMKDFMSPVWFSQQAADQSGNWWDGYYVDLNHERTPSWAEVPGNRDWYRPRSPWNQYDDQWMNYHNRPDAVRQTYSDLLKRFTRADVRKMMWRYADYESRNWNNQNARPAHWDYNQHANMQVIHTDRNGADDQAEDFCKMIKDDLTKPVQIFTIAFEAPWGGQQIMQKCASSESHYYDVDGLDIVAAFRSIASQINQLRLIQ
ncbi:MAG: TadE/TadG family type IV pilus assembly protein [Pseudomonadota bacterium]